MDRGGGGFAGCDRDAAAQTNCQRRHWHTTRISEAPPRLSPETRRGRVTRGAREPTRGTQMNPDASVPRVKVPDSPYRVRGPGDRRDGVEGRWRVEAHFAALHKGSFSNFLGRANAVSFCPEGCGKRIVWLRMVHGWCTSSFSLQRNAVGCRYPVLKSGRFVMPLRVREDLSNHH